MSLRDGMEKRTESMLSLRFTLGGLNLRHGFFLGGGGFCFMSLALIDRL